MSVGAGAPPGVQPGQAPLGPAQQSALASTLARVGPPANPRTLTIRTDPQYQWLSRLHSIRKSIDACIQESLDDRSDDEQVLITALRHAVDRMIKGVGGAEASLTLSAELTETLAPALSQQARAQLDQMSRPPMAPGAPQIAGPSSPPGGGPAGPPVPPPGGGMQPPVPGAMPPGISAG